MPKFSPQVLPAYLFISCFIYVILATGPKFLEAAESLHSGPVQDSEYCHNNSDVCDAVVSNERSGNADVWHPSMQLVFSSWKECDKV